MQFNYMHPHVQGLLSGTFPSLRLSRQYGFADRIVASMASLGLCLLLFLSLILCVSYHISYVHATAYTAYVHDTMQDAGTYHTCSQHRLSQPA